MIRDIAAIVIGRNEGERLLRCFASLEGQIDHVIYVDSASTDGSVKAARDRGLHVVELDPAQPFTAARARNAGLCRLDEVAPEISFVQFLDGDCTLSEGWIGQARQALDADEALAVVCGRRRERFPETSLWNRLIDAEWDTPVGAAKSCGGDALFRRKALRDVGGYRADLIAGEEPEMCYRMRKLGWKVLRIAAEMTLHDAAMTRFGQWWKRCRRAGYAFAEGAALHGHEAERYCVPETRRAVLLGVGVPLAALLGALVTPWALAGLLIWPLQVLRLRLKIKNWPGALFLTLGKLPESQGVLNFWFLRLIKRRGRLIEYK